jgi:hypothetical protein
MYVCTDDTDEEDERRRWWWRLHNLRLLGSLFNPRNQP